MKNTNRNNAKILIDIILSNRVDMCYNMLNKIFHELLCNFYTFQTV